VKGYFSLRVKKKNKNPIKGCRLPPGGRALSLHWKKGGKKIRSSKLYKGGVGIYLFIIIERVAFHAKG